MRALPTAVLALLLVAPTACDDPTDAGPPDGTELRFDTNVAIEVTDSAVLIDGSPQVAAPTPARSLRVAHSLSYEYGGLGSYRPDRLWSESRMTVFGHETATERGDTVVYSYLDFGDLTLDGDSMVKLTDEPTGSPPHPVRYENFAHYILTTFVLELDENGGEVVRYIRDVEGALGAGQDVTLSATGGDDVLPFSVTARATPLPRVTGMENGGPIDFGAERPVLDVTRPLVLEFDGELDPDGVVFALFPWHEDVTDPVRRRAASAFGRLDAADHQVVLPAEVLSKLLDEAGSDDVGYMLYVIQREFQLGVIEATPVDGGESLSMPLVHSDHTRFFLRLVR